jgi:hypothetical protein
VERRPSAGEAQGDDLERTNHLAVVARRLTAIVAVVAAGSGGRWRTIFPSTADRGRAVGGVPDGRIRARALRVIAASRLVTA